MPADILSLSKFRKAKVRRGNELKAVENRIAFGQTKAEKAIVKAKQVLADKRLLGHELNTKDRTDG